MAKVKITNMEKKASGLGIQVFVNGQEKVLLGPGVSHTVDVTLKDVVTVTEVKLQSPKLK